ncbi:MAG: hypothetical protein OXC80_07920, partial [Gammaproteobacteria bacterium]|nr:hypothetical protein [Gammaproteobacteria bacterium]
PKSSPQVHQTKQYSVVSESQRFQTSAPPAHNKHAEYYPNDHDQQRKQHEIRSVRDNDTSGFSKHSGGAASKSAPLPTIVIANPANQSLAGILCADVLCDLHFIAPGQSSQILRTLK